MSKENNINFKVDEFLDSWIGAAATELGVSKSDLIRTCVIHSIPILKEHPHLIAILQFNFQRRQ